MSALKKTECDLDFPLTRRELLLEIMKISRLIEGVRAKLTTKNPHQHFYEEKFYQYVKSRDGFMKKLHRA